MGGQKSSILTLADIYNTTAARTFKGEAAGDSRWDLITPRTMIFKSFFQELGLKRSPSQFVEAMYASGIDSKVLETLPEAVLTPLRDAISACQCQPPTTWSKDLLELVDRSDISLVLDPEKHLQHPAANILVSEVLFLPVSFSNIY
jgi:anaphase-promoting complex subunit 1